MQKILATTDHRPWPLPHGPWMMHQAWHDLLFMHWPVPAESLRPHIPANLTLETFDGWAWLGVVPFRMSQVRPRGIPSVPGLSDFPELNVRTYVHAQGEKPGVFFFSLDATQPIAVAAARRFFYLPYFNAQITCEPHNGQQITYRSRRTHHGAAPAEFRARYAPTAPVYQTAAGSFDAWLTERYCLYTTNRRGEVLRGEIHHLPWPLQPAEIEIEHNQIVDWLGIRLPDSAPLLHFARSIHVLVWRLYRV